MKFTIGSWEVYKTKYPLVSLTWLLISFLYSVLPRNLKFLFHIMTCVMILGLKPFQWIATFKKKNKNILHNPLHLAYPFSPQPHAFWNYALWEELNYFVPYVISLVYGWKNKTIIKVIHLLGFHIPHTINFLAFSLFILIYCVTIFANLLIISLVSYNKSLHSPMYRWSPSYKHPAYNQLRLRNRGRQQEVRGNLPLGREGKFI